MPRDPFRKRESRNETKKGMTPVLLIRSIGFCRPFSFPSTLELLQGHRSGTFCDARNGKLLFQTMLDKRIGICRIESRSRPSKRFSRWEIGLRIQTSKELRETGDQWSRRESEDQEATQFENTAVNRDWFV